MDQFGIGAAVLGAAEVYFMTARGSGRSTSLVKSLNEDDLVVCASRGEAEHLRGLCRDVGKNVSCISVPVNQDLRETYTLLLEKGHGGRRVIFDHGFIEKWHKEGIKRSITELARLSESLGAGIKGRTDRVRMGDALSRFGVCFLD